MLIGTTVSTKKDCPWYTKEVNPLRHGNRGIPPYPCVQCSYFFGSIRFCDSGTCHDNENENDPKKEQFYCKKD